MTPCRAFGAFAGGVAIALALVSCGERPIGTGVVLWSDGGPVANGATVDVVAESTIEDRYLVRAAGADRREEPLPVSPRWRLRVFSEPEPAAEFAARYAEFVDLFAYAVRRGLPVRAEASATAGIVYKLREQEVIKVIGRGAEPEQVGSFENYWYRVLTEDGTEGYTFGEFLPVFESFGDPHAEAARLHADDPGLERVLGTAWRPEEFLSMVLRRRFDLLRLRPEYGLFPDPEARVFRLVTAQRKREFRYREVERVGAGRYVLATAGGDAGSARFTLRGSGALAFSYVDQGRQITEVFVDLQEEVEELIAAERARRERLFAALLERGPRLRSGGYGTIELTGDGRFRWQRYDALVPRWLPDGLPGTGVVDFRFALGAPLRGSYDMAVTLLFDRAERGGGPQQPVAGALAGGAGAGADGAAGAGPAGTGTSGTGTADPVAAADPAVPAGEGDGGAPGAGESGAAGHADVPADEARPGTDGGTGAAGTDSEDGAVTGAAAAAAAAVGAASDGGAGAGLAGTGTSGTDAGGTRAGAGTGPAAAGAGLAAAGAGPAGTDAGEADAGEADAGEADAGEADAGEADAGAADTASGAGAAIAMDGAAGGTGAAAGVGRGAEAGAGGVAAAGIAAGSGEAPPGPAAEREPEYMRPIPWAAELTLLLSYDGDGIRLTPAEPAAAALEVREVNRSAVVMYFAASVGDG